MHASGATKIFPGAIKEKLVFNYIEIEIVCKTKGKKKKAKQTKYQYIHIHTKKDKKMLLKHIEGIQSHLY